MFNRTLRDGLQYRAIEARHHARNPMANISCP